MKRGVLSILSVHASVVFSLIPDSRSVFPSLACVWVGGFRHSLMGMAVVLLIWGDVHIRRL